MPGAYLADAARSLRTWRALETHSGVMKTKRGSVRAAIASCSERSTTPSTGCSGNAPCICQRESFVSRACAAATTSGARAWYCSRPRLLMIEWSPSILKSHSAAGSSPVATRTVGPSNRACQANVEPECRCGGALWATSQSVNWPRSPKPLAWRATAPASASAAATTHSSLAKLRSPMPSAMAASTVECPPASIAVSCSIA